MFLTHEKSRRFVLVKTRLIDLKKSIVRVKSREMQKMWRIFFTCISLSQQYPDDTSFPNFRRKKTTKSRERTNQTLEKFLSRDQNTILFASEKN